MIPRVQLHTLIPLRNYLIRLSSTVFLQHCSTFPPKMSLQGCRNYVLQRVPSSTLSDGTATLRGVRRASDVFVAVRDYVNAHRICHVTYSTNELVRAICDDLRTTGVLVLYRNGFYQTIQNRSNCYVFVYSFRPRTFMGLRSGLRWSNR